MDDVNVMMQACCVFRNFFLNLVKTDPLREAITISPIYNKVFRKVSEARYCRYYSQKGFIVCGTAILLKLFNGWSKLVGRETILLMPVMSGRYI